MNGPEIAALILWLLASFGALRVLIGIHKCYWPAGASATRKLAVMALAFSWPMTLVVGIVIGVLSLVVVGLMELSEP